MSAEPLETIEIETAPNPRASIIWMHGLGADGNDFAPLADEIELPVAVRYIFPHAPMMPVSGANTPITAQRVSSGSVSSGNRQL